MAYQQLGSFRWEAPDFIVNDREAARFRAFHIVAGKHRNYQGAVNIMQAMSEPWTEGEWRSV